MTRIETLHLFDELNGHLSALLRSLRPEDWHRPTMCSAWDVKDIVAHLLDTALRRLSLHRDGYASPHLRPGHDGLLPFLNRLNAEWTTAARRLSPAVLLEMLEKAGKECVAFFGSLDLEGPAFFPVAWAGEKESRNWFDLAREYTERWHHFQQVFEAVDAASPLMASRLYHPVFETFLLAMPFTLRDVERPLGMALRVIVQGDAGGEWLFTQQPGGWTPATTGTVTATVRMPQADAWKAWTKRRPADEKIRAWPGISLEGDLELGRLALCMVSVMA